MLNKIKNLVVSHLKIEGNEGDKKKRKVRKESLSQ